MNEQFENYNNNIETESKGKSIGWIILGLLFPLIGIILFFAFKNKNKKASKGSLTGALIGLILGVIAGVLYALFFNGIIFNTPKDDNDIKACTGKVNKENDYDYGYLLKEIAKSDYVNCNTVEFKLNDDFTIKFVPDASLWKLSINGKDFDYDRMHDSDGKIYIAGKTLVMSTMTQTTVNGGSSTTLINKKGEIYNFTANPAGTGREVNSINTEGKEDTSYLVNENGELVITATNYYDKSGEYLDYLGMYSEEEYNKTATCKLSVDEVAKAYGLTPDDDFQTEYTYKTKEDGTIDFNYSSKKTVKTIKEEYNRLCN